MGNHRLTRLGGDNGLAARSEEVVRTIIVPGERADIVFTPEGEPDSTDMLEWIPVDRGFSSTFNRSRDLMLDLSIVDEPPVIPAPIPVELRAIEPISLTGAIEHTLDMTIETDFQNRVVMGINGIPYWDVVPIEARVGETHIWHLKNATAFAHPFHLHGYYSSTMRGHPNGKTPSTCRRSRSCRLRCISTHAPVPGCTTATFSTMPNPA